MIHAEPQLGARAALRATCLRPAGRQA